MGDTKKKEGEGQKTPSASPTKQDLQNSAPSKTRSVKDKVKEMLADGIQSEAQAKALMKLMDVKPKAEHKGKPVVNLMVTVDGNFFYDVSAAANHIKKTSIKNVFFTIRVKD